MKLYREVKAGDRLPEKDGWYWVYSNYTINEFKIREVCIREVCQFRLGRFDEKDGREIEYWLEPIEITEEEIADIIHDMPFDRNYSDAEEAAEAILSKLKGVGE